MNITVMPNNNPNLYLGYIFKEEVASEALIRETMTPIIGFAIELIELDRGNFITRPLVVDPCSYDYFIIDMFTDNWTIPYVFTGHGIDKLVQYLNEENAVKEVPKTDIPQYQWHEDLVRYD